MPASSARHHVVNVNWSPGAAAKISGVPNQPDVPPFVYQILYQSVPAVMRSTCVPYSATVGIDTTARLPPYLTPTRSVLLACSRKEGATPPAMSPLAMRFAPVMRPAHSATVALALLFHISAKSRNRTLVSGSPVVVRRSFT